MATGVQYCFAAFFGGLAIVFCAACTAVSDDRVWILEWLLYIPKRWRSLAYPSSLLLQVVARPRPDAPEERV
jgi:hypothetical protein